MNRRERIAQLKSQIEDLQKRWPAHSVPPSLMAELDDLENQLEIELEKHRLEEDQANVTSQKAISNDQGSSKPDR